jgi:hypothetical protein
MSDDLVERVARAIAFETGYTWGSSALEHDAFRDGARAAIRIALEEAARVAELAPYNRGGMVCGCSEGLSNWTAAAIRGMIPNGNDPAQDDTGNAE